MEFDFDKKVVVESEVQWDLDTLVSAWNGLDSLLDELNERYKSHTQSAEIPYELDYKTGHKSFVDSLNRFGATLITNAKDSIHIRGARQNLDYMGRIEVGVSASDDQVRVSIEDNGAGIHPEIEPYLFMKLSGTGIPHRILKSGIKIAERIQGIDGWRGVDLSCVREKVVELGGKVFYENKGQNVGAIFGYEVPIISLRVPQVQST